MKSKFINSTLMLASFLVLGLSACKKDKTNDPTPPPVETKTITITEVRSLSTAASVKVPDGRKVKGIVISDASVKNIDSKTVILQEATDKTGIVVTFDAAHTFAAGDEVELTISNQTLAQVNGEVTLQNIPSANAKKTGTGTITAKATTIADVKTNKATWSGTLVTINATDLTSADGKYKGTLTLKDASGELTSAVVAGAAFENTALPASVSKLTGIVRLSGNDVRIDIRNTNDVVNGDVATVETFDTYSGLFGLVVGNQQWAAAAINAKGTDASFTDANNLYSYIVGTNTVEQIKNFSNNIPNISGIYNFSDVIRSGAKEVTVYFAGSSLQGDIVKSYFDNQGAISPMTLDAFDPGKHRIKIGIGFVESSGSPFGTQKVYLTAESATYTDTGIWHSLKIKLPTTDAELQALGIDDPFGSWLGSPKIAIYNLSTKRSSKADWGQEIGYAPILIKGITVGY